MAVGTIREIGPVITGLMLAGRSGAMIAAELGSMKVTEQVSALTSLTTPPGGSSCRARWWPFSPSCR